MRMGRWAGVFVRVTIDPEILVALLGLQLRLPTYVRLSYIYRLACSPENGLLVSVSDSL